MGDETPSDELTFKYNRGDVGVLLLCGNSYDYLVLDTLPYIGDNLPPIQRAVIIARLRAVADMLELPPQQNHAH